MLRKYGQLNVALLFVGDAVALAVSWLLSYLLRFQVEIFPVTRGYPPVFDYLVLVPFVWLAWLLAARITGLYGYRVGLKSAEEIGRLTRTMAWTVLMLIALTFFYREKSYSRLMVLGFMVLGPAFLFLVRRLVWSAIRRLRRRGVDMRRILVAGTSSLAVDTAERLAARFPGAVVSIQPVWGASLQQSTEQAVTLVMAHPEWRLSLQTHKFLGLR